MASVPVNKAVIEMVVADEGAEVSTTVAVSALTMGAAPDEGVAKAEG